MRNIIYQIKNYFLPILNTQLQLKNNNNNNLRSKRYAFFVAPCPVSRHATPYFYFILFSLVASLKHKLDDDDVSINSNLKTLPCFLSVLFFCFIWEIYWLVSLWSHLYIYIYIYIYIKDLTTNTHISQLVLLARVTMDLVLVIRK